MRINLGVGDHRIEKFINVDCRPIPQADIVCDIFDVQGRLGFADGTIDEIYAGHLLEHFYIWQIKKLLKSCNRWLKDGGILWVVIPDFRKIFDHLKKDGKTDYEEYNRYVIGLPAGEKEFTIEEFPGLHHTLIDEHFAYELLTNAGFKVEIIAMKDVPHTKALANWQSALKAIK